MPHKVHAMIDTLSHGDDVIADKAEWQLVLNWCLVTAQMDSKCDSLVSFAIDAVTEGDDGYLGWWIDNCLDSTIGAGPRGGPDIHM
jgi:hypothetical protein